MDIESKLYISLNLRAAPDKRVIIHSTRAVQACQVFQGKSVNDTLTLLPLLFSICGTAQAFAGVLACEQAKSITVSEDIARIREALLTMETLREHLWRLFLDWPQFISESADKASMAEMIAIQKAFQQVLIQDKKIFVLNPDVLSVDIPMVSAIVRRLHRLLEQHVFGQSIALWLTMDSIEKLEHWAGQSTTVSAKLIHQIITTNGSDTGSTEVNELPALNNQQLWSLLQDEKNLKRPQWQGECCETSSFTRVKSPLVNKLKKVYANGLLVRVVARLTEIAQLSRQLMQEKGSTSFETQATQATIAQNGNLQTGIGQVAAARGQLIHQVLINNDKLEQYRILAPTEWNFHPEGVVAGALSQLEGSTQRVEQQARMIINSIDPCVAYELKINSRERE